MARGWCRVALAVVAAFALAGLSALSLEAQSDKRPGKTAPSKQAKAQPAEEKAGDDEGGEPKAAAKKKKQDPVEAQRTIEAAAKLVQAGKQDQAIQSLTGVLNAGNLPPPIMAKALYTRGVAYREKSQPAQALSDLTSALWLKGGLNEADRADAMRQRSAAFSDAGLTESGDVAAAPAPGRERGPAPGKGWSTETAPSTTAASSGGWLESLFGASAAPAKASPAPPAPPPPAETASIQRPDPPVPPAERPVARPRIAKAWSSSTEVHADGPAPLAAVSSPPPPARPAAPAREAVPEPVAKGKFRIQLATVRTKAEAQALATKAQREHAAVLASRAPEIDETVLGNMGSFYRVRFGPYGTAQETQAVCAKLRGSGFDCMAVAQ